MLARRTVSRRLRDIFFVETGSLVSSVRRLDVLRRALRRAAMLVDAARWTLLAVGLTAAPKAPRGAACTLPC